MKKFVLTGLLLILFLASAVTCLAQAKTPDVKKNARPAAPQETAPAQSDIVQAEPVKTPTKQNKRPVRSDAAGAGENTRQTQPVYFYEFSQPEFVISKIVIEHDENGKGKISFTKRTLDGTFTDPIQVSPAALERIRAALTALNFLDSTEDYQYEKDYSHLGNIKIRVRKDGREREVKFNWTQNLEARALAHEYRKLANQYIWIFDITVSRENQPLDAPRLLDLLNQYMRRNEIADQKQMLPLLRELGDDERIPLIARNHAKRLAKEIEKQLAKAKD